MINTTNNGLFALLMNGGQSIGGQGLNSQAGMNTLGEATAFTDLLAMVSDMQMVDASSGKADELLTEMGEEFLKNAKNEAGIFVEENFLRQDLPMIGQSSSETEIIKNGEASIFSKSNLLQNSLAFTALGDTSVLTQSPSSGLLQNTKPNLSSRAIEMWSIGLGNGAIKSVLVSGEGNHSNVPIEIPAEQSANNSQKISRLVGEPEATGFQKSSQNLVDRTTELTSKDVLQQMTGVKGFDSLSENVENNEKVVSRGLKEERHTQSGKDVILDRYADLGLSVSAQKSHVVTNHASLGSSSDNRISEDSIKLVADKVEQLKSMGGGTLRVSLEQDGLGAIEIRVSQSLGRLDVKLLADSAETAKLFQSTRGDLLARLETVSKSSLEIVHSNAELRSMESMNALPREDHVAIRLRSSASGDFISTADFLTRGVEQSTSNAKMNFEGRDAFSKQEPGGDRSHSHDQAHKEWSREDRREKARESWQEFFTDRKAS